MLFVLFYLTQNSCNAWSNNHYIHKSPCNTIRSDILKKTALFSSNNNDGQNPNLWSSSEDNEDWQDALKKQTWSSSYDDNNSFIQSNEEAWLDTLQSITAEEVTFMEKEAERADKMRQMQEYGYSAEAISATLGVATSEPTDNPLLNEYQRSVTESSWIDPSEVESHTTVERDEDTNELLRSQMVYVDEHSCIGCTNCAMIAQSTFFMHQEHGRARVFQQWGDDDETIAIAIQTCPVDCIHYVPYDELKRLEIERRDQNINFKARLVSQGEYGGGASHRVGGAFQFTEAQKISGNMRARCRNCPTAGCINCPMYGVGENPEFRRREKIRKERRARKIIEETLKKNNKAADL